MVGDSSPRELKTLAPAAAVASEASRVLSYPCAARSSSRRLPFTDACAAPASIKWPSWSMAEPWPLCTWSLMRLPTKAGSARVVSKPRGLRRLPSRERRLPSRERPAPLASGSCAPHRYPRSMVLAPALIARAGNRAAATPKSCHGSRDSVSALPTPSATFTFSGIASVAGRILFSFLVRALSIEPEQTLLEIAQIP